MGIDIPSQVYFLNEMRDNVARTNFSAQFRIVFYVNAWFYNVFDNTYSQSNFGIHQLNSPSIPDRNQNATSNPYGTCIVCTILTDFRIHHLFKVFCFSASLINFFPATNNPFLVRTTSIYLFATFSRSANSPKSSNSSSVAGTQNGSSSRASNPAKISCGDAAPDVRLRISSENPNDSATGNRERMVKKGVPSFMVSERMRPRRRVITP